MSKKGRGQGEPALGSEAFGAAHKGPTGSAAVGGEDSEYPLRGAQSVGVDPAGGPTGSEAFGGAEPARPLKGAILVGNDPAGNPTGSEAVGGSEQAVPLKGAILIGNDPEGFGRGAAAFGTPDAHSPFRGAEAVGAPQLVPERLEKDVIGYDFQGVLLRVDHTSLAGARKDPADRVRGRVLAVLCRTLGCAPERLRHGLGEDAIPWGRLRRARALDRELANVLREAYQRAPNGVLGIGHVRDVLHTTERMHTVAISGPWDTPPLRLTLTSEGVPEAVAASAQHKEQRFFVMRNHAGEVLAYVDGLTPNPRHQGARVRDSKGELLATFVLQTTAARGAAPLGSWAVEMLSPAGAPVCEIREQRAGPHELVAQVSSPGGEEVVGSVTERTKPGHVHVGVELDLKTPRVVAYAAGLLIAELARLRRQGGPATPPTPIKDEERVEDVETALGPRRRRRT